MKLLLRHGVKSSTAQIERLIGDRPTVLRLHVSEIDVVTFPVVFEQWPRECCPARATENSLLPCGRYLLAPLTGNKEGSTGLVVL